MVRLLSISDATRRVSRRQLALACAVSICAAGAISAAASQASAGFTDKELMNGFYRTVFGLEFSKWDWSAYRVKKYTRPVRLHIHNLSRRNRTRVARQFVHQVDQKVKGLSLTIVERPEDANFHLYVVDRNQYSRVVRSKIFGDRSAHAPGRCMVRVTHSSRGISSSSAVIVSDEGRFLFNRCLAEEILQGLGPMNDDVELRHSVFNDTSKHTGFTDFDRYILNMLYHPHIRPGMSKAEVERVLPAVLQAVRADLR